MGASHPTDVPGNMNELTTKELALAMGVSESSIKRWADDGTIRASRTAGGHRRIPFAEAVRFIRQSRSRLARPELVGLPDVAAAAQVGAPDGDAAERFFHHLRHGHAAAARGLVQALYLAGESVAAIVDGPMREALSRIGELWRHDPAGIFVEHRATDLCVQALNQLRATFEHPENAPVAVGGAPAGDPYLLPSLAAATALAAEGFVAVNLGADTPLASLERAVGELRPLLAWVSVSSSDRPARLAAEIEAFAGTVRRLGVSVIAGGRGLPPAFTPDAPNLHVGASLGELVAFARGLASAMREPARLPRLSRGASRRASVPPPTSA